MDLLWIALGGVLGACGRFLLGRLVNMKTRSTFPWGTWIINISGSIVLGWLARWTALGENHVLVWKLMGVGFCGAYTTFSTFGYETVQLMERKEGLRAAIYVVSSVMLAFIGAWLGWLLVGMDS